MIHKHIESEKQLTIHTCSGTILKKELIDVLKVIYASEITPNHIWNFTKTDLSQIKGDDLQEIVDFAKQHAPTRIGGRTALVSDSALGFGLARMFEFFAKNAGVPVEIGVFYSPEEAKEWISAVSGENVAEQIFYTA